MKPHRAQSRGTATILAIVLLGTISATVAMVGISLSGNFTRLRNDRDDAQLRQYELASLVVITEQLRTGKSADGEIDLPGDAVASVHWESPSATERVGVIKFDGRDHRHVFRRDGERWIFVRSE